LIDNIIIEADESRQENRFRLKTPLGHGVNSLCGVIGSG